MSKLFTEKSYWYFHPSYNYEGHGECASYEDARNAVIGATKATEENYGNASANRNEIPIDFLRLKLYKMMNVDDTPEMDKGYNYPIILFMKNGKLLVKRYLLNEDEKDDEDFEPRYSYSLGEEFVLSNYEPTKSIYDEVGDKFGVNAISMHYIGSKLLGYTMNFEGVPTDKNGDPLSKEQDVILCTEWKGTPNIAHEDDEELVFARANKFSHEEPWQNPVDYGCDMLTSLSNEINNYGIWANLLYFLIGPEKMKECIK